MSTYITPNRILDFTLCMQRQNRSANTISSYTINIQKLELFLNGAELSKDRMLSYKQWLTEQGFKKHTVNAYLAAANYFCEVMGWQEMKVMLEPITPDEAQEGRQQISSENYKKLVYTALQNDKNRMAMMLQVLCHMDLRFCELEHLTVEALECGYVEVKRKSRTVRVELPDMIREDLKRYVEDEKIVSGIVFCTRGGKAVNRSNFRKELRKLCVLAGVDEEVGSIQHVKNVVLDSYPYYGLRNG